MAQRSWEPKQSCWMDFGTCQRVRRRFRSVLFCRRRQHLRCENFRGGKKILRFFLIIILEYCFATQMRRTKKVSLFPVGIVSDRPVSTPMLSRNGTLINFYEGWLGNRTFPVDMAGFAVNVKHFISVKKSFYITVIYFCNIFIAWFQVNSKNKVRMAYKKGYEEDSFLKELEVLPKDVEFLASNCSKVISHLSKNLTKLF